MQLDPDKARELAECGASILLLDVPAGTRVGLDHQVCIDGSVTVPPLSAAMPSFFPRSAILVNRSVVI